TIKLIDKETGKVVKETTATKESGWKYEFTNVLSKDSNGKVYEYRVEEVVPKGYKVKYDGTTIINEYKPTNGPSNRPGADTTNRPGRTNRPGNTGGSGRYLPVTGDGLNPSVYAGILALVGGALTFVGLKRKKKIDGTEK
ncbi:Cna B-type domain-containing protein, partial [Lagierella sp.]|uniref:Cna B-type domain-containing protein n=1 Tax=Lagierella sp. TaxID=2849657 RepID=UPI00261C449D